MFVCLMNVCLLKNVAGQETKKEKLKKNPLRKGE
jgi:hypothetical protein